jgi:hypothetical protein
MLVVVSRGQHLHDSFGMASSTSTTNDLAWSRRSLDSLPHRQRHSSRAGSACDRTTALLNTITTREQQAVSGTIVLVPIHEARLVLRGLGPSARIACPRLSSPWKRKRPQKLQCMETGETRQASRAAYLGSFLHKKRGHRNRKQGEAAG